MGEWSENNRSGKSLCSGLKQKNEKPFNFTGRKFYSRECIGYRVSLGLCLGYSSKTIWYIKNNKGNRVSEFKVKPKVKPKQPLNDMNRVIFIF